jgi:hypothetical protein
MADTNTPPWLNGQPDYEGWVAEYGGKVWGEVGDTLHPPTEEGRQAAEDEGEDFRNYYAHKTDDEGYIETLYFDAAPVEIGHTAQYGYKMCDCCDWGYGWMGEPEVEAEGEE